MSLSVELQPVATMFSQSVREALAHAARTPVTGPNCTARIKAVEKAMKLARERHPALFRSE